MSASKANDRTDTLLAELKGLSSEANAGQRVRRAWEIALEAVGDPDLGVLIDYAVDNGLVQPLPAGKPSWRAGPAPVQSWINPIDGSEMIWIPPGPFWVGDQRNRKRVEAPGFSLARHPVTNAQFARFLEQTEYVPPDGHPDPELFLSHWEDDAIPAKAESSPVVWVSYVDALHYCRWAGLTLPTEWHWEKAARGPEGRLYPWGGKVPQARDKPRLAQLYGDKTCPVGSFPQTRTPYGCEDMIGNVSEWCQYTKNDDPAQVPAPWPTVPKIKADPDMPRCAAAASCGERRSGWSAAIGASCRSSGGTSGPASGRRFIRAGGREVEVSSEPRTQRSGVSGPWQPLTPLRCVRGSDSPFSRQPRQGPSCRARQVRRLHAARQVGQDAPRFARADALQHGYRSQIAQRRRLGQPRRPQLGQDLFDQAFLLRRRLALQGSAQAGFGRQPQLLQALHRLLALVVGVVVEGLDQPAHLVGRRRPDRLQAFAEER